MLHRPPVCLRPWLVLALLATACGATIGGESEDGIQPPDESKPGTGTPSAGAADALLEARVWRLTRVQYDNTVRDLLGDTSGPARKFLPEEGGTGFDNAELTLGFKDTNMADFNGAAMRLAADTVAAAARLTMAFPCGEAKLADETCGREFVASFGRRAFRRPLTPEELARYQGILALAREKIDPKAGVQAVIEVMLQSPHFLFRSEIGAGSPRARLSAHEIASQLSYYLHDTMPDPMLAAAADDGTLLDRGVLERHARRLMADPRARPVLTRFFTQALDYAQLAQLDKAGTFATPFKAERASYAEETTRFVEEVLWKDDGTLGKLLAAPYTMANATVGKYYGVAGVTGTEWRRMPLDGKDRAGFLTHPGLMSVTSHEEQTSPILRGKLVNERLLCRDIPDPPPEVMTDPPKVDKAKTTRQLYQALTETPGTQCVSCHAMLNAPGYAFEHLDAIGRVRRTDNGHPVDTTGKLTGTDVDGPFAHVGEMATKLSASEHVRACVTAQLYRYASGRKEAEADAVELARMSGAFARGGLDFKELALTYVLSERFTIRRAN